MRDDPRPGSPDALSLVHGPPLASEPGMGALTIPGYAREVTERFAEREALVLHGPAGVERWSYAELWARSMAVAKALVSAGLGKGARVGVLLTNRPEYLALVFGTALAGGISVPLSTFSTPFELEHLLAASGISILVFERRVLKKDFAAMLAQLEPQLASAAPGQIASERFPFLQRAVMLEGVTEGSRTPGEGWPGAAIERWEDFLAGGRGVADALVEARAATVTPADPGVLFFSSGTTSLPKGILHAQRALAIQWWRWARMMGAEEPVRSWTGNGFFWSGNLSMVVGMAFTTGGAVVLQPTFQPQAALELMQTERVTFPNGRPHQWARLQEAPNWSGVDLSSCKYIDKNALLAQHPTITTEWRLPMAFGTTETLTVMTHVTAAVPLEKRRPGDFGPPLPGNTLKIVDPMTGEIVPRGERGEVAIKGPTLMMGYIGKPLDEVLDDHGFFRTGDGGYVDAEGHLFWEGRLNDIIKTGGANVSPLEVDDLLAKYPGVKQSQTVGVPHETLSEMVVSCILPREEATVDEAAITAYLKERLASFKVPRRIVVFREEEWPVTGSGKPKASALKELAFERLDPDGAAAKRQAATAEG